MKGQIEKRPSKARLLKDIKGYGSWRIATQDPLTDTQTDIMVGIDCNEMKCQLNIINYYC